jgi:hypothetical protein
MEVGGNRDQFIRVLDDHREECEKEGDYHEAKVNLPPRRSAVMALHSPRVLPEGSPRV